MTGEVGVTSKASSTAAGQTTAGRTAAGQTTAGQSAGGAFFRGFDPQRFAVEVANEIGVRPDNLGAYGLTEQQVRQYETSLHSRTRSRGSR